MKINIHGQKITITEAIKTRIEEKISKLDKYLENPDEITANVVVRISGVDQIIEVTIPAKKVTLRGEERNKDLYTAIDSVVEKIERQIRKNKTKIQKRYTKELPIEFNMNFESEEEETEIIKRKRIEMKPMSAEEAVLQMNLLDHTFFLYKDVDTDQPAVVYRRTDGGYGVLETN